MVWFLFIELALLILAIFLYKACKYVASGIFVLLIILIPATILGSIFIRGVEGYLAPYVVYGRDRVQEENIRLVGLRGRIYIFSNGEEIEKPQSNLIENCSRLGFLLGGGIVLLSGYYLARSITYKIAPEIYELLLNKRNNEGEIKESKEK